MEKVKAGDLDGVPDMAHLLVRDDRLYVVLRHLDRTAGSSPVELGEVVVINTNTDEEVTTIVLHGMNPVSELQFSAALNRILVSSIGTSGVHDGGIEAIDPTTNTVDLDFVIDEATIGGDITHFQIVSATQGFAVVTDATFNNSPGPFRPHHPHEDRYPAGTVERLYAAFCHQQPWGVVSGAAGQCDHTHARGENF